MHQRAILLARVLSILHSYTYNLYAISAPPPPPPLPQKKKWSQRLLSVMFPGIFGSLKTDFCSDESNKIWGRGGGRGVYWACLFWFGNFVALYNSTPSSSSSIIISFACCVCLHWVSTYLSFCRPLAHSTSCSPNFSNPQWWNVYNLYVVDQSLCLW